ncbi:MAG: hypothetical protein KBG12_03850 [Syntrophobacterales bacterium]|nr:hypothetical protein [Syntrophobacterales bacterium]
MYPWQSRLPGVARPFLQPMAMFLVCVVFISLILVTGLVDLRRLEQTLLSFMEGRGLDISAKIQRDAQENFTGLTQVLQGEHAGNVLLPLTEETFLPQESFVNFLVGLSRRLAREIDQAWTDREALKRMAEENHLWLLALLDEEGRVIFRTRQFPPSFLARAASVVAGERDIDIDIFREKLGSIALRRGPEGGTLLVVLDGQGLRYWGMKFAVQKAVEEAVAGQKLPYVAVVGTDKAVLALVGDLPEKRADDEYVVDGILKGRTAVSHRKFDFRERKILEVVSPLYLDGALVGAVRVGLGREDADQVLGENRRLMIISMAFVMSIGLLSVWLLYRNQNRHLARMEEMGKELQKSERLSALGQLAAGVAHEIRNPLNAISMASQRLQREFQPVDAQRSEEFGKMTVVIRDEIRRLNGIIEEFLAFSRSQRLELLEYPVEAVLQKLVRLVGEEAAPRGIAIETAGLDSTTPILMDVDKLQQAFLNIIKNAMESINGAGKISVFLEAAGSDGVSVRITDTGGGLTPEEIDRIFNPEYTTKEKGLGLGLPIAHEIIRSHGGDIRVQSRVGVGTTFDIRLPRKKGETEETKNTKRKDASGTG